MPDYSARALRLPKPQQAAHGGLPKPLAAAAAALAIGVAAAAGSRFGPTPAHPATAAWYARLRKPSFTPPGPVFGVAWTLLDALLCYSGYRLLCRPARPARTAALAFWGATVPGLAGFPMCCSAASAWGLRWA